MKSYGRLGVSADCPALSLLMSGKRQHFIPQFLQEGFASHRTAEASYTWVFRKGLSPFNPNIANIGVEGYFYTTHDDTAADELITEAERSFAVLVHSLRTVNPGNVSDPLIPKLIAHLEARTRHLRQGFLQAGDYLMQRMLDFLSDEKAFLGFFERKLEKDPSILSKSFGNTLASRGLPQNRLGPILELSKQQLPVIIDRLRPLLPRIAESLRPVVTIALKDAAKSGHIRVLKEDVAPMAKTERYRELVYSVVDVLDQDLILGDSILIFHVGQPRIYKTFLDNNDCLAGVYLPLSPSRVLVGTQSEIQEPPSSDLRTPIASCSLEFFIAHKDTPENRILAENLGDSAALITTAELEEIIASKIGW